MNSHTSSDSTNHGTAGQVRPRPPLSLRRALLNAAVYGARCAGDGEDREKAPAQVDSAAQVDRLDCLLLAF